MMHYLKSKTFARPCGGGGARRRFAVFAMPATAQDKTPIKIGFGMAQTGPLGPNGKQALFAVEIWAEETNAKGGLLGRPVELVYYDDQSNPSAVPGIYTKLLDVDKVDLVVGGYATNQNAPAMPVVIRKGKTYISLFSLDVNDKFNYPKYFSILPTGPDTKGSFTEGFFAIAAAQKPKLKTVALLASPTPSSRRTPATEPAPNAKKLGLQDRLRQELSAAAQDHRFRADRARDQGCGCRHRRGLRLSARLGRHGARGA